MRVASKTVAYILWLVLGILGAHRYYVGRWKSGLVWTCTAGLCGFGWLIDLFLIPSFVEEYNTTVFQQQFVNLTGSAMAYGYDDYENVRAGEGSYFPSSGFYAHEQNGATPEGAVGADGYDQSYSAAGMFGGSGAQQYGGGSSGYF